MRTRFRVRGTILTSSCCSRQIGLIHMFISLERSIFEILPKVTPGQGHKASPGRCSDCNTAGRGRFYAPPLLTRLLSVAETCGRQHSKDRQKPSKNYIGHFSLGSKLWHPGAKNKNKIRVFREWRTALRKTSIISGTMIDRTNQNTAFEKELNSPSLILPSDLT